MIGFGDYKDSNGRCISIELDGGGIVRWMYAMAWFQWLKSITDAGK